MIENPDDEIKFTNAFQRIRSAKSFLLAYAIENQNEANNGANERANKRSNERSNNRGNQNGTNNCSPVILFIILPLVAIGLYWVAVSYITPDPIFRFKSDS